MDNILFFGDSLTAGYGLTDPNQDSLPALIQQMINETDLPYKVTNAGLSGDSSAGGLARLDYWTHAPFSVFILELGINDFFRGVPTSSTYENLDIILQKVKKKNPHCKIMILGIDGAGTDTSAKANEFRQIFKTLANLHGAALIPFFLEGVAGVKHLNLADGLHPTNIGYRMIAEKIWPTIRELLKVRTGLE